MSDNKPERQSGGPVTHRTVIIVASIFAVAAVAIAAIVMLGNHSTAANTTLRTTDSTISTTTVPPTTTTPAPTTTTPPAPTTTEAPTAVTPERQFANDAINQIPAVSNSVNNGSFTSATIGSDGDNLCNDIPVGMSNPHNETASQVYATQVEQLRQGYTGYFVLPEGTPADAPDLATADGEIFVSLAIEDVCPRYKSNIPYGDPGAP